MARRVRPFADGVLRIRTGGGPAARRRGRRRGNCPHARRPRGAGRHGRNRPLEALGRARDARRGGCSFNLLPLGGNAQGEHGDAALACRLDVAVVRHDDFPGNGEPQPRTALLRRARPVFAVELLEDGLQMGVGYLASAVGYGDGGRAGVLARGDGDDGVRVGVGHGVAQHVAQRPGELVRVDEELAGAGGVHGDADVAGGGLGEERLGHLLAEQAHSHSLPLDGNG